MAMVLGPRLLASHWYSSSTPPALAKLPLGDKEQASALSGCFCYC